ncbi:MAG TPA: hypothetical protein VFV05_00955, partial [Methylomirabilota bacterium]|nr:hypothetical protein [Methylomirabilota bacterium]
GPRANWFGRNSFVHSHEGGDKPHKHEHTGPACYTIDKDDWFRATGLRGGGRKKFTARPTGEQFPVKELEDWQKSFEVVVCDPPGHYTGEGPGIAPAVRMQLALGMSCAVRRG